MRPYTTHSAKSEYVLKMIAKEDADRKLMETFYRAETSSLASKEHYILENGHKKTGPKSAKMFHVEKSSGFSGLVNKERECRFIEEFFDGVMQYEKEEFFWDGMAFQRSLAGKGRWLYHEKTGSPLMSYPIWKDETSDSRKIKGIELRKEIAKKYNLSDWRV